MDRSNILRFAGEINIVNATLFSLSGTKLNISNQILTIEIYEDMFSPFTSANIVLSESIDLINLFPLIGEEYIELNLVTPTSKVPIKNVFYIYKISDRIYTAEREVTYSIKCISKEFISDSNTRIKKSIYGNIEESAKKIISGDGLQTEKNVVTEKTTNDIKFASNFWSPVKCLGYLASSAISGQKSPSFLFFENRNGFNFVSINALLQGDVFQRFTKDNYTRDIDSSDVSISSYKNIIKDYSKIIDLNVPVITDYITAVKSGQVYSKVISHDILTKRYHVKDYSLLKDVRLFKLLNDNLSHTSNTIGDNSSVISVIPRYYNNYMGYSDNSNYKILQRRNSFFENLKKQKITIEVFGRTEYTVGLVVEVDIPAVRQISKEDSNEKVKDKLLSGRYLITAVSHKIDRENHICKLELMKNSVLK